MPFLTVNSQTVKVKRDSVRADRIRFAQSGRSFSGTLRVQMLASDKRVWRGQTPPLPYAEAQQVITLINNQLVTVSGDMVGNQAAQCWGSATEYQAVYYASGGPKVAVVVEFVLEEV